MLHNALTKARRPSPIRLIHSSHQKRAFGLIFWISDYRRTTDVVVMLYAMLSLNQFFIPAMSLSVLFGSMVSKWSLIAIYLTPYFGKVKLI